MTRPSDITRERILKAAERLFADHGYEGRVGQLLAVPYENRALAH